MMVSKKRLILLKHIPSDQAFSAAWINVRGGFSLHWYGLRSSSLDVRPACIFPSPHAELIHRDEIVRLKMLRQRKLCTMGQQD